MGRKAARMELQGVAVIYSNPRLVWPKSGLLIRSRKLGRERRELGTHPMTLILCSMIKGRKKNKVHPVDNQERLYRSGKDVEMNHR